MKRGRPLLLPWAAALVLLLIVGCTSTTVKAGPIRIKTWPTATPLSGPTPVGRWAAVLDYDYASLRETTTKVFPTPKGVTDRSLAPAVELWPDGTGWDLRVYRRSS